MKKVAFITGTGKGIGKAIAELLIEKSYIVFGYSRTNTIKHPNFTFTKVNLCEMDKVKEITFPKFEDSDVILINNAATIGEIVPLNIKNENDIINEYNVNIISPSLLCAKFINSFTVDNKIIINIGSGAANNAIPAWNTYCATKAALDMLTKVISEEKYSNLKIFSVHPGIVDTEMQMKIRKANVKFFPLLNKFRDYYYNNKLENTKKVAQKFLYIIENHDKFTENVLSIQDVDIN